MLLYHGSNVGGIRILEPKLADHERPYIYLAAIEIVAGFYMVNAVERPYYWFPYGFTKSGQIVYDELYPDALREVSEGRKGFIYTVDVDESNVLLFKNIPCARLGTAAMEVKTCVTVDDCYQWLLGQEGEGKFKLGKYEEKSKQELQNWYDMIFNYIRDKGMFNTPDCSYARFVQQKFPNVWEQYLQNSRQ